MRTWSVLVVDDEKGWQDLLQLCLNRDSRFGIDGVATDGRAAIQAVQGHCPDAIILDVNMPKMDGLQALPLLRQACPRSVIVMHTSDPTCAETAERLGADAVLDKGETIDVSDRLAELCERRHE